MNDTAVLAHGIDSLFGRRHRVANRSLHDAAARREWAIAAMRSWIEANLPKFMPASLYAPIPVAAAAELALTIFLIVQPDSPVYGTPVDAWARRIANRIFARLPDPSMCDCYDNSPAMSAISDPAMLAPFVALAKATGRIHPEREAVLAYVESVAPKYDPATHIAQAVMGLSPQELGLWMRIDDSLKQIKAGHGHNFNRVAARDLFDATLCLTQFGTHPGRVPIATKSAIQAASGRLAKEFLSACDPESAAHILLSQTWNCGAPPDFDAVHELVAQISRDGSIAGQEVRRGKSKPGFDSQWSPTLAVFRAIVLCAPAC